ncbi:MAG: hypothetical protein ACI38A_10655, partial [Candidatus Ornithomonoglobus sp.]
KVNGTVTRTIYLDGSVVATDNAEAFPVFWGNGSGSSSSDTSKIYFDNLSVTSLEMIHATVNGEAAAAAPVSVPAVVYYGEKLVNGVLTEDTTDFASLANNISITAGNARVVGIKAYNGDTLIGTGLLNTTLAQGSEAIVSVILDKISTESIGMQVIE